MNRVGGALLAFTCCFGPPIASCSTFGEAGEVPDAGAEAATADASPAESADGDGASTCPWVVQNFCSETWGNENFSYSANASTVVLYRTGPIGDPALGGYPMALVFKKI